MGTSANAERVMHYFREISKVPRCSGHRDAIAEYLVETATKLGAEVFRDEADNVIITKPGSPGWEHAEPVALQGHTDMVCEKTADSTHDFTKDPIRLVEEGTTMRADGTTLGGDNGIAVAMMLAILEDSELRHPPLEMICTSDEEIGLLGAERLDPSRIRSRRLINIDSEEEDTLFVGCAGGELHTLSFAVQSEPNDDPGFMISVDGLLGGHSGMEIHRRRHNAIKVLTELLTQLRDEHGIRLVSLYGGSKHNAIPRQAEATVAVPKEAAETIRETVDALVANIVERDAANGYEDEPIVQVNDAQPESVLTEEDFSRVLSGLTLLPTGVHTMSNKIDGLVQTSSNFAIVNVDRNHAEFQSFSRSSDRKEMRDLRGKVESVASIVDAKLEISGEYPAWEIADSSALRETITSAYRALRGEEMKVTAIHAGLECGLFSDWSDNMDLVSMGPNLFQVHTPQEHMDLASVARVYELLCTVLEKLES